MADHETIAATLTAGLLSSTRVTYLDTNQARSAVGLYRKVLDALAEVQTNSSGQSAPNPRSTIAALAGHHGRA
jgi:hypothetical protein